MAGVSESHSVSIVDTLSEKGKVVIEEVQKASRGHARPVVIADEGSVITDRSSTHPEWLLSILTYASQQGGRQSQKKPQIRKVPTILRDVEKNKTCYDPMVVSIGPYHHGNSKLALVEELKTTIAEQLVLGNYDKEFHKFDEVALNARECYVDEGSTAMFNDEEFARMMFLDGCFILHFIQCMVNNPVGTMLRKDQIPFVLRDMFLLENQLPFEVIQALMSLVYPGIEGEKLVNEFIKKQANAPSESSSQKDNQPPHLLHLLRTQLIGTAPPKNGVSQGDEPWHSFRSVNELREAGIKCKKSDKRCLLNVHFVPRAIYGYLELPQIVIDDSTKPKFLNLVAYEACPDFSNDYEVTSYISFLDALIDRDDDVKELRSQDILLNCLGSDQQVADLFNELAIDLVPNLNIYGQVMDGIDKYYRLKWRIWMAEMLHTHFSSPWTTFAFFAAALIIILTLAQTFFAVYPMEKVQSRSPARTPKGRLHYNHA